MADDRPARPITIIDVLDNFEGGLGLSPRRAQHLTIPQIDEFGSLVNQFYAAWTPPINTQTLTIHPGSLAGLGLSSERTPLTRPLFSALLYYPRAIVHDPLHDWFNRDKERLTMSSQPKGVAWVSMSEYENGIVSYWSQRDQMDRVREILVASVNVLESLRPLIVAGVVIPVPQWRIIQARQQQIMTSMRMDLRDDEFFSLFDSVRDGYAVSDFSMMKGLGQFQGIPQRHLRRVQGDAPLFYLNKVISLSNELGATYVPPYGGDYDLFLHKTDSIAHDLRLKSPHGPRIVHEVGRLPLPIFERVSAENLVKIRENEDAFEDFRVTLNQEFLTAFAAEDPNFPEALQETVLSSLAARVKQVEAATSGSSTLKAAVGEARRDLILGATSVVAGLAVGQPVLPTAIGAGAVSIASAVQRMVFRPGLSGAKLVISGLLEGTTHRH